MPFQHTRYFQSVGNFGSASMTWRTGISAVFTSGAVTVRVALDYSLKRRVPQPLLEIFELLAMRQDEAWYVEHVGMTKARRLELEERAVQAAHPHLKDYLDALDFRKYCHVPLMIALGSDMLRWFQSLLWASRSLYFDFAKEFPKTHAWHTKVFEVDDVKAVYAENAEAMAQMEVTKSKGDAK
ncbi:hypothetical protein EIP91_010053 [Steccherinum ochraceum]|uniref:Uncharacterized protein n=1 Tax=Steccherinum ochraceum TaxID=92696 RepID=A0A4R0R8Y7_9APHY|nr:hypothetical protein EIP91_010053 [Steccherinum ochraceum]